MGETKEVTDMDGLEAHVDKWVALRRSGRFQEAGELYKSQIFPLVQKRIKTKTGEALWSKYYGIMLTVGTSPEPLILTLSAVHPQKVFFLYTKKSEHFLCDIISGVDYLARGEVIYDRELVEEARVLDIYQKIRNKWEEWGRGCNGPIGVDNTGGKKSMVSAAAVAAYFLGLDLLYVDSEEYLEDIRAPKPGTEYLVILPNPLLALGDLRSDRALELFNAGLYDAAHSMLEQLYKELAGREAIIPSRKVEMYRLLAEGYRLWDLFRFTEAVVPLDKAANRLAKFDVDIIDFPIFEKNLGALHILARESCHRNRDGELDFFSLLQDSELSLHFLADIYANALRRADQGKYDDALIRLYRTIELVGQHRLANVAEGLDSSKLSWSKVPQDSQQKFMELGTQLYGSALSRLPEAVGLVQGHLLLYCLNDALWQGKDFSDLEALSNMVKFRNHLILVHATNRADRKDFNRFRRFALGFLRRLADLYDFVAENLIAEHTFPRLVLR
ncbi:TIGR02710 family CRISPR-associated CARF protein [Candidatus Hakubella thermalkaliphila]|uniref:Csm6 6H domain-containing protein n=3 Tax=Candidatus Hakubella thermalkaliphila TaxID=2754717 RepID=A0A6V8PGB5_9ACTN|nr:TIGR02710 family CRISPR-associated CARF protein [Candidatus Hakubella thermalkaliphila]GFP29871.1 hypothetical protein HKBW3S34_00791 [Candidatus Hakubella thermalkaliphila]GFP39927.1 hypothetical protein HKBW3S47_01624 [Candidatus Hakubella thermalkaliphila]